MLDTVRCTSGGWVKSYAAAAVFLLLLPVGVLSNSGTSVTILLFDGRTSKPIPKATIFLITWDEKGAARKLDQVTTRKDGSAVLSPTDPLPERIGVSYSPDELKNCSDTAFPIKQILALGIIAKNNCGDAASPIKFQPKPGQLVAFASKISLSERLHKETP